MLPAVIGSGVLYLPFYFSILGWVGGIIMLLTFGGITWCVRRVGRGVWLACVVGWTVERSPHAKPSSRSRRGSADPPSAPCCMRAACPDPPIVSPTVSRIMQVHLAPAGGRHGD